MASTARLGGVGRDEIPATSSPRARDRGRAPIQAPEGEAILRHLVDFLDAFMWQGDPATLEVNFATRSALDVTGHPVSAWVGGPDRWGALIDPSDRTRVVGCLRATADDGLDREVDFACTTPEGTTLTLRHAVRLVEPPSGPAELWGVTTNRTREARASEALRETEERFVEMSVQAAQFRRRALEDPLTHLPNRILFQDRLATALRSAERSGEPCAVLLLDLDHFKEINDTKGHAAGDAALKEFALRFRICLRTQDTPARIGGDEFAAVLPNTDSEGAGRVAERIVRALREPVVIDGEDCTVGVSIGVAPSPTRGSEPEELLARADRAMYRAKASGGGIAFASDLDVMPQQSPPERRRSRRTSGRAHRRIGRRLIVGVAAALAILAGATAPVARHHARPNDPGSRLAVAADVLRNGPAADVQQAVAGVERTLADISWTDVRGSGVVSTLTGLERTLRNLRSDVQPALGERIDRLIATIRDAEQVSHRTQGSRSTRAVTPSGTSTVSSPDPRPGAGIPPALPSGAPAPSVPPLSKPQIP